MADELLFPKEKRRSEFESLCPIYDIQGCSAHDHTVKYRPFLKQDDYIDYRIVDFLRNRPLFADLLDWDKLLDGEIQLPYTHTEMSEDAWKIGVPKFFPVLPTEETLPPLHRQALDIAWDWAQRHFGPHMCNSSVRTHDQVLKKTMLKTSMGYPMNKWWCFKSEAYGDPQFLEYLKWYWEAQATFRSEDPYYLLCLKDEFRPTEKVNLHKTRVFAAASADHVYCSARLLGDQLEKLTESCLQTASAIGLRQTNLDFQLAWEKLLENLNPASYDAKNWDGNVAGFLLLRFALFCWKNLKRSERTEANWNRLLNNFRDGIFSQLVLPDGSIFITKNGMKSGEYFTAHGNTVIHFVARVFIWLTGLDPNTWSSASCYDDFMEHSGKSTLLFGDDCTASHSDEAISVIGPQACIDRIKFLGMEYEVGETNWEDLSFLSHQFHIHDNVRLPKRSFWAILSGWLQDGDHTWQRSLERTSAYRIQAFVHPLLYEAMTEYMDDTIKENDPKNLCGCRDLLVSDGEIAKLHLNSEGFQVCKSRPTVRTIPVINFYVKYMQRLNNLLSSGKITKAEFDNRVRQRALSLNLPNGSSSGSKSGRKKRAQARQNGGQMSTPGTVPQKQPRRNNKMAVAGPARRGLNQNGNLSIAQSLPATMSDLQSYIGCIGSPESAMSRVPTRNSKYTTLYRSQMSFPITYNSAWSSNLGRFSVLAKPGLGQAGGRLTNGNFARRWKVNLADGTLGSWNAVGSWTQTGSYVPSTGGKDLQVDKFTPFMTQQDAFYALISSGPAGETKTAPLGTNPDIDPANYNFQWLYSVQTGGVGGFFLSPGNYAISTNSDNGTTLTGDTLTFYVPPGVSGGLAIVNRDYQVNMEAGSISAAGDFLHSDWLVTVFNPVWVSWQVQGTAVSTNRGDSWMSITSQYNNDLTNTLNGGAIDSIRPVAMSLLVTSVVPGLVDGGIIVGKRLNKNQCNKDFFADITNIEVGNLQNHEALADTGNIYTGKFKDGCRVIWAPEDESDLTFFTPDEMNGHDYPCLIISGQFIPGSSTITSGVIARAILVTVYEFETSYTVFISEMVSGNDILMSEAFNIINGMPSSSMNGGHWDIIKQAMARAALGAKSIGKWAWANKDVLIPLAKSAGMAISVL